MTLGVWEEILQADGSEEACREKVRRLLEMTRSEECFQAWCLELSKALGREDASFDDAYFLMGEKIISLEPVIMHQNIFIRQNYIFDEPESLLVLRKCLSMYLIWRRERRDCSQIKLTLDDDIRLTANAILFFHQILIFYSQSETPKLIWESSREERSRDGVNLMARTESLILYHAVLLKNLLFFIHANVRIACSREPFSLPFFIDNLLSRLERSDLPNDVKNKTQGILQSRIKNSIIHQINQRDVYQIFFINFFTCFFDDYAIQRNAGGESKDVKITHNIFLLDLFSLLLSAFSPVTPIISSLPPLSSPKSGFAEETSSVSKFIEGEGKVDFQPANDASAETATTASGETIIEMASPIGFNGTNPMRGPVSSELEEGMREETLYIRDMVCEFLMCANFVELFCTDKILIEKWREKHQKWMETWESRLSDISSIYQFLMNVCVSPESLHQISSHLPIKQDKIWRTKQSDTLPINQLQFLFKNILHLLRLHRYPSSH